MPTAQRKLDYSVDAEDLDATVTAEEALKYTGKGCTNLWEGIRRGLISCTRNASRQSTAEARRYRR